MKRLTALTLCVIFLLLSLASCGFDPDDKGAILPVYLTEKADNLDPTVPLYDKDTVKYTSQLFQGLTVVDENGKVSEGLAKSWKTDFDDERGEYFIEFTLKDSHWSDGRALLADHFVYAWKRILSPANASDAACLLYDVKNAAKVKSGEMTPDALGVSAPNRYTLRVELEKKMDIDLFLETVASPALVPLRYDVVDEHPDDWATSTENLLACGPFTVSSMNDKEYLLEKSTNYLLSQDPEVKESPNKYVKPAKLYVDYTKKASENWNALLENELHYIDVTTIPAGAEDYLGDIKSRDLLATSTLYLDNTNDLLMDKDVRSAMSLALDREKVAELLGFAASPATGFVSNGVFDTKNGSSFRKAGGELISASADAAAAKAKLAGKSALSTELTLTYRSSTNEALAQYLKTTWEALGLKIKLNGLNDNPFRNVLKKQEFDILLLDFQGLSTSAYSFLMPFATAFSGNYVDIDGALTTPHMTGFANEAYNALADQVFAATNRGERVKVLHEMEKTLIDEMPIIPLAFWSNCYILSDDVKGITFNGFGCADFTNATVRGYQEKNAVWQEAYDEKQDKVKETTGEK